MFKAIAFLIEAIGWLQIAAGPLTAGLGLGFLAYTALPESAGVVIAAILSSSGLIAGIIMATRVWKKRGATAFLSGISATPDFDDKKDNPKRK
jgi:hypothetical protein